MNQEIISPMTQKVNKIRDKEQRKALLEQKEKLRAIL